MIKLRRPQKLYWRPAEIPLGAMLVLAAAALAALIVVETFTHEHSSDYYSQMLSASRHVQQSIESLRPIRGRIEPIDPEVDPLRSGLIGLPTSSITSNSGSLDAKQATINPNWAAVVIRLLAEAGVKPGDQVAVAVSGSFPALNLAVYTALEAMDITPLIIVSGSGSQWGANVPGFAWLDIAGQLRETGLIKTREIAATLGGIEDRGIGMDERGLEIIRQAARKADVELFEPDNYEAAVVERIQRYTDAAGGRPIAAFINVGGGTATTGPSGTSHYFGSGLLHSAPSGAFKVPSVMGHYLREGVPVINFSGLRNLTTQFDMPYPPVQAVSVGSGGAYRAESYRRWLAGSMILALLGLTALIMRSANIALAAGSGRKGRDTLRPRV